VQKYLFVESNFQPVTAGDDVAILSAPGESRECVEIARLVRDEAERGTPFDQMAVLLRAPEHYRALLEEAFARAGIPIHLAQGTRRPDPAGRAFLALLACAGERLSARRFAEYLSLGEVPETIEGAPPAPLPRGDRWVPPDTELSPPTEPEPPAASDSAAPVHEDRPDAPVMAGSLRAPWRWEKMLLDAAVIGGRSRWERRLAGLEQEFRRQLESLADDEARAARVRRDLSDLHALREFA